MGILWNGCRRGYPTYGPGDSCSSFVQSHHFLSYGDEGQYQFDETRRDTDNKLYHWRIIGNLYIKNVIKIVLKIVTFYNRITFWISISITQTIRFI